MKTGIFIQNCLGWLKIGLVMFMVLTGLFVVIFRSGNEQSANTMSTQEFIGINDIWTGSVWNWGVISTAFFKVFYSYNGLQVSKHLHGGSKSLHCTSGRPMVL